MKYLIISDIHGSSFYLKKVIDIYKENKFDKLLILGDILYHGPRNDLPLGYNPKECIKLLNELKEDIIAIKGNCEAEVDEMVLDFKIYESVLINDHNLNLYLTHGHKINPSNPIKLNKNSIVLYGHTHVHKVDIIDDIYYINPGSLSIPKENQLNSYMTYFNNKFEIKDLDNNILKEVIIDGKN